MLFQSKAKELTDITYQAAVSKANDERKAEVRRRLDMYHDDQIDYLRDALRRNFQNPNDLTPCFVNVVKKIVNNLAMVYVRDAKREIEGSERDQEIFREIKKTTSLPIKLKMASRYTKLLKTILLRPVWRKGRMDLDILTGDVVDVASGDTPEDIRSVMVTHFPESNYKEDLEYTLWTLEKIERLNYRGQVIESDPNPYGLIPFIPCFDRMPTSDFWLPGGDDLITLQEAINEKLTDLLYTLRMQGFGVGWARGMGDNEPSIVGPGTMFNLPDEGAIGFESTKAPIDQIVGSIDFLIKQAAVSNGLPAGALSTKPTEESGVSKIVSNRELDERRRDDVALWSQYEEQLFDVIRVVWNIHNPGRKISGAASLLVDFFDPKPEQDPAKQADTWLKLLDAGIISRVDIAMEKSPDLKSRDQAKEHLKEIEEEQAEFAQKIDLEVLMRAKSAQVLPRQIIIQELVRRGILSEDVDPVDVEAMFQNENRTSPAFGTRGTLRTTAEERAASLNPNE
jgi:hypothetical protein